MADINDNVKPILIGKPEDNIPPNFRVVELGNCLSCRHSTIQVDEIKCRKYKTLVKSNNRCDDFKPL